MLDRPIQAAAEGLPKTRITTTAPAMADVVDRLDDAADLAQALIMAAGGATGCDEKEIAAISRLALRVAEDIRRAKSLLMQARETLQ